MPFSFLFSQSVFQSHTEDGRKQHKYKLNKIRHLTSNNNKVLLITFICIAVLLWCLLIKLQKCFSKLQAANGSSHNFLCQNDTNAFLCVFLGQQYRFNFTVLVTTSIKIVIYICTHIHNISMKRNPYNHIFKNNRRGC